MSEGSLLIQNLVLIDIDGLRPDVFESALHSGRLPNFARLLGGQALERGVLWPVAAPAPSITFTSQACLFTGAHPAAHCIAGNQFFDRFGRNSGGTPRHYAFDVGDTISVDDAVRVFVEGLASNNLQVHTLYEQVAERNWRSVVAGHMYARGAQTWLRPNLAYLARFTKGGNLFGLSAPKYDRHILKKALTHLEAEGLPNILTVYFMGVDHESHRHGPQAQQAYLIEVVDPMIGELWEKVTGLLDESGDRRPVLWAVFSDHGQIGVPADDRHSLRLSFPFEREMGLLFDSLGLDVHDFPGEDPHSDAVVASNGGLAQVYLCNRMNGERRWAEPPDFEQEVLPVARAFWEAHTSGSHAPELRGSLRAVLARDASGGEWKAPYRALSPEGTLLSLHDWFDRQPEAHFIDPVHRLNNLVGPMSGDLILISDYSEGYYFAAPEAGVHGGLHPEDSYATLAIGLPQAAEASWLELKQKMRQAVESRCAAEGGRLPGTVDLLTALYAAIGEEVMWASHPE